MKIFVSAYACEPDLGSEIGVGWHWILEMSKYFEVWVLTRQSNKQNINRWLNDNTNHADIHFLYFDLPQWMRFWKKGLRGVHLYYYLWQRYSNGIVKQTMQANKIEIFHHLTYGNALWSVSSFGQKQCFIWGPIGGLETIPKEYSRYYGVKSRFIEWLRRMAASFTNKNKAFKCRCRNANLILCKTNITQNLIPQSWREKSILFTDVAIDASIDCTTAKTNEGKVNYLMVGRLDAWRGFDLAIESFALAKSKNPNIHLNIVGKGKDEKRLKSLISERGLQNDITMFGEVTKPIYEKMLAAADVFINASLKEANVTVSFESLAQGKPQICLDSAGYTRLLKDNGAIIISQGKRNDVIQQLYNAILLLTQPCQREILRSKALKARLVLTREEQGRKVKEMISETYAKYCRKRQSHDENTEKLLPQIAEMGHGAMFYNFTNAEGKKWLLPTRNRRTAIALYQPGSYKGKLLKTFYPYLFQLPIFKQPFFLKSLRLSLIPELQRLLENTYDCSSLYVSIFCGTPSATPKITIQVGQGKKILGYCKLTDREDIAQLFYHEQEILGELSRAGIKRIPQCLYCGKLNNGVWAFAQTTFRTENIIESHQLTSCHRNFLEQLHTATKKKSLWEDTDFAKALGDISKYTEHFLAKDRLLIHDAVDIVKHFYCADVIEFCTYHGDFTPWNTFIIGDELYVFDFEHARRSCPPYMDACHYISETAHLELKMDSMTAFAFFEQQMKQTLPEVNNIDYLYLGYLLYVLSFYSQLYHGEFDESYKGYNYWMGLIRIITNKINCEKSLKE